MGSWLLHCGQWGQPLLTLVTPSPWAVWSATVDLLPASVSDFPADLPRHLSSVSSWLCLWETPPLRYFPRPATPTANLGTSSWELASFLRVWVWRLQGISGVNKLRFLSGSPVPWKYNCFTHLIDFSPVCSWPFPEQVLRACSFQVTDLTDWFLSPPPTSLTKCQENCGVLYLPGPALSLRSDPWAHCTAADLLIHLPGAKQQLHLWLCFCLCCGLHVLPQACSFQP